jgi:cytochrome c oxidase accessory protein FixG
MESYENIIGEDFRDSVSTIDKEGKRVWVFPKKPSGKFYNARTLVSILLLILLFGTPFIHLNGEPLMMFNILERKFIILGQVFMPQDFFLLGLSMLSFLVFIVLFTVIFGRLFCGWVCPQTIFMEMVFRKIEYWIEGDFTHQKALKKMPWNREKILKRSAKFSIFFVISFLIANTFLSYIIGQKELLKIIQESINMHIGGFLSLMAFTGVFFFVFTFFREQVCIVACPYGRLQGVLLDKNSIVVAYDYIRGEPRSKYKKVNTAETGDCIDCKMCVKVCPTGIDIRNGTQLECVNCTACIDACDDIMVKVNKPKGLIRYASENAIALGHKLRFSPRIIGYTAVLSILLIAVSFLMLSRSDIETTILRAPGTLYNETQDGMVSNIYTYKMANKTHSDIEVSFVLKDLEGEIKLTGASSIKVLQGEVQQGSLLIFIEKDKIKSNRTDFQIDVISDNKIIETVKTTFVGPVPKK